MDLRGRMLDGRYQLGSVLGVGGMARVYLAEDRVLQRQVAVKVLSPPYDQDPLFVERFRREARTAAGLSHPNIVAVFDSGSDGEQHYLVMEYVAGQSLAELLAHQGRLAPRRAGELASQVCAALAAAHTQGVVHRDVKPGNVLVAGDGLVKVTDFGIAKAATSHTLTGSGMVLGTAAYLSPEQARGGPVDARSDLYGLGCVLYELLTGTPPFGSGADGPQVAIATRHLSEPPEPPSWRNQQVDPGWDAVVLTALAKQPAQRYQSAIEMQDDLRRVLAGPAAAAGPDGLGAAGAPTQQLPRLPAGAGAASTGVGPLGAAGGGAGDRGGVGGGVALAGRRRCPGRAGAGRAHHHSRGDQHAFDDRTAAHRDVGGFPARGASGTGQPDRGGHRRPAAGHRRPPGGGPAASGRRARRRRPRGPGGRQARGRPQEAGGAGAQARGADRQGQDPAPGDHPDPSGGRRAGPGGAAGRLRTG